MFKLIAGFIVGAIAATAIGVAAYTTIGQEIYLDYGERITIVAPDAPTTPTPVPPTPTTVPPTPTTVLPTPTTVPPTPTSTIEPTQTPSPSPSPIDLVLDGTQGYADSGNIDLSTGQSLTVSCVGDSLEFLSDDLFCYGTTPPDGDDSDHATITCPIALQVVKHGLVWDLSCGEGPAPSPTATQTASPSPSPSPTPSVTSTPLPGNVTLITNGLGYANNNPSPNTTYQCASGVVLNGQNQQAYAFHGAANNVTIRDCEIINYDSPFQEAAVEVEGGSGWVIVNNNIHDNANGGINIGGANHRASGNYVHHNGQYGIAGGDFSNGAPGHNLLIENNEIAWNNTAHNDAGFEAGGGKFTVVDGVTWRGNNVHHNSGPGIWCDAYCHNVVIEENNVHDNGSAGIFFEISYDAVIRDNTLSNNSTCDFGLRCETESFWKKNMIIYNSGDSNIQSLITGNVFSGAVGKLLFIHHDGREVTLQNWLVRGVPANEINFFCEGTQNFCNGLRDSIVVE